MGWLEQHWTVLAAALAVVAQWTYFKYKLEDLVKNGQARDVKLGVIEKDVLDIRLSAATEQQKVANIKDKVDEVHETVNKIYDLVLTIKRRTGDS